MSEFVIDRGNFLKQGALCVNGGVVFTFPIKGKEAALCIYDANTKSLVNRILVTKEYIRGKVASITVGNFDIKKHAYTFEFDGCIELDTYAKKIIGKDIWGKTVDYKTDILCGVVNDKEAKIFDAPSGNELIIYKLHLRGITMDKDTVKENKGNYNGLIKSIPRITKLGFNAVCLMPVYEYNEIIEGKINYWGYGDKRPFYMAPKSSFFGEEADKNFKKTIDVMHNSGLAVIMEFCFYGDLKIYEDEYILETARYYAFNYGIDGFKFIGTGIPKEKLYNDNFLCEKYLFFESFPYQEIHHNINEDKRLFLEDNSFMYTLRRLQNHMDGNAHDFCNILRRQEDYFGFINTVAASNGFTLLDAYSYCDKHNEENGEDNRDGNNYGLTTNCGIEGPTKDRRINKNRMTAIRTALVSLFFSQGVPLLNAGDEMLNSQNGNNNPYCQDNKIGWVNYSRKKDAKELSDYIARLTEFRKTHPVLSNNAPFKMNDYRRVGMPDVSYHGKEPWVLEINESRKSMGILFTGCYGDEKIKNARFNEDIMLLFNFYNNDESFLLPKINKKKWYFISNTKDYNWDIDGKLLSDKEYIIVPSGTITILIAK